MGDCVSMEVPPASAVVLALPGQGGLEDEAATDLYLVCWKSDWALWGVWSRLEQDEKRKHRLDTGMAWNALGLQECKGTCGLWFLSWISGFHPEVC